MRTSLLFVVITIASLTFFSCQKEPSNSEGDRLKMIRIKDRLDTTYVDFKLDENRNVSEETATHKKH